MSVKNIILSLLLVGNVAFGADTPISNNLNFLNTSAIHNIPTIQGPSAADLNITSQGNQNIQLSPSGSGDVWVNSQLDVFGAVIADRLGINQNILNTPLVIEFSNASNSADSSIDFDLSVGGPLAGNPLLTYHTGSSIWAIGIDNSTQSFVIANNATLASNRYLVIDSSGNAAIAGTITAGTGLTVTTGGATITGTTNINASGSGVTNIGTGGTGAVNIGNATGNTAITGFLTASTLTATSGNVSTTNGNLVLGTAGNKISIATGTNGSAGTTGNMTGGNIAVSDNQITANSLCFFETHTPGTVTVAQSYRISARTPGTGFVITSSSPTDTSTVDYFCID